MRHKRELVYVTLTEEDVLEAIRLACFTCYKAANGTHSQDQWLLMKNQRLSLVESRNKVQIPGLSLDADGNSSYAS